MARLLRPLSGFAAALLLVAVAAGCAASREAPTIAPEVARGKAWYTTCAGCHGNAGEGFRGMNAPRLAGQSPDYLTRQLVHFRSGVRGGAADFYGVAMNGRAKALPDEQAVHDVVAYIATLPAPPLAPAGEGDATSGRALFESCAACHGARGEGNPTLQAPAIGGLDSWYVARQLANFRKGIRGREGDAEGEQMRAAAALLPDEAADRDVAAYVATLR
ncbi:c-type cytochrome [Flavisphingomonas formosensis]|uniref:c-type cytochrome n=1 Tax=Flavisphingomonas formosensis TaxID=861534 RepID=UPI0012FA7F37|nr:c-type cytochrome [Sphingomonas formosensis]